MSANMGGFNQSERNAIKKHSTGFLLWGLLLAILGVFALGATYFTTLITVSIIGVLLLIAGALLLLESFAMHWGKWSEFFYHILVAIVYIVAGGMLVEQPLLGSITFTFVLGVAYVAIGLVRTYYAYTSGGLGWGWTLNGLITLLLGILILASWPSSSLWVIGLFVGIDLIFAGWAYILIALAAKSR